MSIINYAAKVINFKVVYYGPGLAGKTANLQYIHRCLPDTNRGKMISLATGDDRTLFFDFLPVSATGVRGFTTRFQLYTVPGQTHYNMTRKLVLRGVDGVVFVADSQARQLDENIESFQDLHANLSEQGIDPRAMPLVVQYNKQDLPKELILTPPELSDAINFRAVPEYPGDALHGPGVFETLRSISELVLKRLSTASAR